MLPPAKLYFFENAMPSRKDTRLTTQNIITVAGMTEEPEVQMDRNGIPCDSHEALVADKKGKVGCHTLYHIQVIST